jgi:hypothetical protein
MPCAIAFMPSTPPLGLEKLGLLVAAVSEAGG